MRTMCVTVDVDRDVNDAVMGSSAAISLDRGEGKAPRFTSSKKGTELLLNLFDEMGIKATYFLEARTSQNVGNILTGQDIGLHGLDHEDFTGLKTGVVMDEGDKREIVEKAISMIRDAVGIQPKGFRFPYTNVDEVTLSFLPEYGMKYDSSQYVYLAEGAKPYKLDNGMIEIPLAKGTDSSGNTITSYLWPMHEGKRLPEDFIKFADSLESGIFVLSTHSWHVCESREKGILDVDGIKNNLDGIRKILERSMDNGYEIKPLCELSGL